MPLTAAGDSQRVFGQNPLAFAGGYSRKSKFHTLCAPCTQGQARYTPVMNAIIISIGDELALGQTVDTNSAWMSQQLAAVGCDVVGHTTVPDDQPRIERAMAESATRADVVIVSGGIGPTEDDLTRQALAAVLKQPLELNAEWITQLDVFFKNRGRVMPEINKIQAMIPRGVRMVFNTAGTAAGMHADLRSDVLRAGVSGELRSSSAQIFVVPGVPKEMKAMFVGEILPVIKAAGGGAAIVSRTLHTFGLGESALAEKLGKLMDRTRSPSVGTTVSGGIVSLRLNSRAASVESATIALEDTDALCRAALGDVIFGSDNDTLAEVVAKLLLKGERPLQVATAESCTGGLLAKMLTDIAGSSAYFHAGWVTYSNDQKYERLGVPEDVINVYGAVSEPVVEQMAASARRLGKADFALAISGIAGPGGGSATKPVGTVCICLAEREPGDKMKSRTTAVRTFNFPGDREMIRDRSAKMALTMLRYRLMNAEMPF